MARTREILLPWTQQPQTAVTLRSQYQSEKGAVFLASAGYGDLLGKGNWYMSQTHPSYSGPRFPASRGGIGWYSYADNGGSNDDRLSAPVSMPTARAGPFTTVLAFVPRKGGLARQEWTMRASHSIEAIEATNLLNVGYDGENGYRYLLSSPALWDAVNVVVISTKVGTQSQAANGDACTYISGAVGYVGGGTNATSATPRTGDDGFSNYYHPLGEVLLQASLPDVFVEQEEALDLSRNPWQLFEPRRVLVPVAAGAPSGVTLAVSPATVSLTGQTVGVLAARKLAVAPGSVSLTGQTVGALYGRRLPVSPATIGISGQTTGVKATRMLPVAFGAVAFTGATVAPLYGRTLTVEPGSITFNGASIGMQYGSNVELAVDPGTLTVTGATVDMRYGRLLGITAGSLAITGQTVNMRATRLLDVSPGAVTFAGAAVGMSYGRALGVSPGSIAFTGQTVNARVARVLTVDPGAIAFTGGVIVLDYSGEIVTFDPQRMAMIPINLRELRVPVNLRELRVPPDAREIQA